MPARLRCLLAVAVAACTLIALPAAASAAGGPPAPGWGVYGAFTPGNIPPGGDALLHLYVYDIGSQPGNGEGITLVARLPEGVEATAEYTHSVGPALLSEGCSGIGAREVVCHLPEPHAEPEPELVLLPVNVSASVPNGSTASTTVSVSGGGALAPSAATVPMRYSTKAAPTGFANADLWLSNPDGTIDTQAGSHPYALTMMFTVNEAVGELPSGGEAKNLNVNLPPGLVGEPTAVAQCSRARFDSESEPGCPRASLVGEDIVTLRGLFVKAGEVFNLVPPPGVAAELGFIFSGQHVLLDAKVRSGGDYGITVHGYVPQEGVDFNSIQIWGVPGEHGTGAGSKPFLTLPTSCGAPPMFKAEMLGTWQRPDEVIPPIEWPWRNAQGQPVGLTGCGELSHFEPKLEIAPDTTFSDTPTGLTARVRVPQGLNPEGLATPGLKETTVTLPQGVSVNPGRATGLTACAQGTGPGTDELPGPTEDGESERFDAPPQCPNSSKVGTDKISTPLLGHPLEGNVYVLTSNPPEIKLLVAAEGEGVFLKLIGTVHLDETTGQLVTTFKGTPRYPGTPDAPLNEFVLNFSGGPQAALVTPETCGQYTSNADFTPWSTPLTADFFESPSFLITAGPGGTGSCTAPLPFTPTMHAGATTDHAGAFTNFSMLLTRPDGQQRIKGLSFTAPPGLEGMLSKVPLCHEAEANAGTCPEASKIGHTVIGAGPGPYPLYLPEAGQPPAPIYLTEGYGGAPFGLSVVLPIHAGPFTLPTQVVRAKINVGPKTAQITVTTDPLPQIVAGVPADLRTINAVIDREGFMFNPTNCSESVFSGSAAGTEGATAAVSSRFQVLSCRELGFSPSVAVDTGGQGSRTNGAGVSFKISYPKNAMGSQSWFKEAKFELPKQLPARLTTIQQACLAATFEHERSKCPAHSIIGHAVVHTPVLPVPLEGPVYFVSYGGAAFPDAVLVLDGYGVHIELHGNTFIDSKTGITSATFKETPDVPFESIEVSLPSGPFSEFGVNLPASAKESFCGQKLVMPTFFKAQNGLEVHQNTALTVTGCSSKVALRSHTVKKRTVTVSVYVPGAGTLHVAGRNLGAVTKKTGGQEIVTLTLHAKRGGRFSTHLKLAFVPTKGTTQATSTKIKA